MNWQNFRDSFAIQYVAQGRNPNDCLMRIMNVRHLALALWAELQQDDVKPDATPRMDDYVLCWEDTGQLILGLEEAVTGVYLSESTEYPGKHWVQIGDQMEVVTHVVKIGVGNEFANN